MSLNSSISPTVGRASPYPVLFSCFISSSIIWKGDTVAEVAAAGLILVVAAGSRLFLIWERPVSMVLVLQDLYGALNFVRPV